MDQDQVAHFLELEDTLSKIRAQINSKLDNQKHIAIILSAVEENIDEQQSTNKNIVNYVISFMSLLDQAVDLETREIIDLQLSTSATYLLDLVFAYVPKKLLRSQFAEILTKIAPCITDEKAQAPLIKSAVGCLEALLIAQDAQSWNNTHNLNISPRRGLNGLLELSLDPRPKVRKRAQEAIRNILSNPPPFPTPEHVAAPLIADFAVKALVSVVEEASNISNKKLRAQGGSNEINSKIIHTLKLISVIASTNQWPSSQIETLCDLLLEISKTSDQFLVSNAFQCFESLFQSMAQSSVSSGLVENKFLKVLDIIFSLKPSKNDSHLAGAWIAVIAKGVSTYAAHQPLKCLVKIPEVFKIMSFYLSSETPEIHFSASQCLIAILTEAIQDNLLLYPPLVDEETFETVDNVMSSLSEVFTELLSIKYIHCAKEVLNMLVVAFNRLRYRCNPDFIKPLEIVGEWRTNEENFLDFKTEAEQVIGAAISSMGPDVVLSSLPLNLENPSDKNPGRAWLLPIIRDYTKNAKLSIFINDFIPLIKYFEATFEKLPEESVQLKVFQTVVDQIWSTLPRFCELPSDLRDSFTDGFASELASLLYGKVELRPTICHALKVLVQSNSLYVSGSYADDVLLQQQFPVQEAQKNLEYLSSKSANLLAVLFNIFTQTAPNARGHILETIDAYLKITASEDLAKTFDNICGLLKNAFDEEGKNNNKNKNANKLSATLLDLIVAMTKYVPESSYPALFSIFNTTVNSPDPLIQKRSYRIITKLSELEKGSEAVLNFISDIEKVMIESAKTVHTSSKAARLAAIKTLVELLPSDHLGFIVQLVAEIILSTKDVNEKSREAAFGTLISMAQKMGQPGGIIKLSEIPGYDSASPDQSSSVAEFFKIISAGLIGESQHMVSATVTAYACLVFEFKDQVSDSILLDIYDTVELYLTSNSREIVKSAIGFTKVCCLGLPDELMRPKVPALLPKLLRWSHEHTGHFKAKVKHIIERLVRRFGCEFVEQHFPEEDRKLLVNIRKTRNRSKRKQAEENAENAPNATGEVSTKSSRFMSALDEALYDSSDADEGDREDEGYDRKKSKQFIVESKENPLDLLDSQTLAHISSTRPRTLNKDKRKRAADNEVFNFDSEGKLVVKNEKTSPESEDPLNSITSGINAYLEAVKHGPIRGQKNKLKFKRGKRAGDDNDDFSDGETKAQLPKKTFDTRNRIGKKKGGKFKSKRKL